MQNFITPNTYKGFEQELAPKYTASKNSSNTYAENMKAKKTWFYDTNFNVSKQK